MERLEPKSSAERRNYQLDWTQYLGEDTISSSIVSVAGVTLDSQAHDDTTVMVELSGGDENSTATITNTITTAAGLIEAEVFTLAIYGGEPVSLSEAKAYLRVTNSDEDAKIGRMIVRARRWVEDHTGIALVRREFVEYRRPENGNVRLFKGPLISVSTVDYTDSNGDPLTFEPIVNAPGTLLGGTWPVLSSGRDFAIRYTAGVGPGEVDDRLIGAMLALIEGEYSDGGAYPQRAVEYAERCCGQLRMVAV